MFGLEKKKKNLNTKLFFDLEKDLEDENKYKSYIQSTEKHLLEIKDHIRKGSKTEDFEKLGIMLHGYSALLKILTKK